MNNKVQSLWIGNSLSNTEILCLKSFIKNGYEFDLYHYSPISNVPTGVTLRDAREILPEESIFKAHGGFAIFADYFRVVLLFGRGGLWVDMDVVCLKRLEFLDKDEIVLGFQAEDEICNAVMQFPALSELGQKILKRCEEPWLIENTEMLGFIERTNSVHISEMLKNHGKEYTKRYLHVNAPWGAIAGPYGVTEEIKQLGLLNIVKPINYFHPVHYNDWWCVFYDTTIPVDSFLQDSYTIHLWGQCFRSYKRFSKNDFQKGSFIHHLWQKYS